MKTEQELQELQKEVKELKDKLSELSEDELEKVCGGKIDINIEDDTNGRAKYLWPFVG